MKAEAEAPVAGATGPALYERAKTLIPGGTQLLSKRPEMFLPGRWPAYYSRARGAEVWDLDGNRYVDMSYSGIGACVLGYADPDVDAAVIEAVKAGSAATLNCPEEVELARVLCEIHPWAQMARFTRSGGEAMSVAVRIGRARSRRDRVAFCGYHGWHDWYISANLAEDSNLDGHLLPGLEPAGVPRGLRGSSLPFRYNHLEELERIVREHPGEVGVIVLEPVRNVPPEPGFLEGVRRIADEIGAVLVVDEITTGFRTSTGGVHLQMGLEPDIAVFAKALSNGYAMAAVIGKAQVMSAAQDTFVSSTSWTERVGPAAALATIAKHRAQNVGAHLVHIGRRVRAAWTEAAAEHGLEVDADGLDPLLHVAIKGPDALAAQTLYHALMLERGFLVGRGFYANFAHTDAHVDAYAAAVGESFAVIADARRNGTLESLLEGPVVHTGFRRLT
ncbi:MAG TPA: aminotransferase class III-fold pyridoxal phosphate-dependent enzyme [Longimicrobium sp.]